MAHGRRLDGEGNFLKKKKTIEEHPKKIQDTFLVSLQVPATKNMNPRTIPDQCYQVLI